MHSFDDIQAENIDIIKEYFKGVLKEENAKLIVSTRALYADLEEDRKIFLKAFTKEIFKEY